ncbi:MAG: NYN domain-containing protein [Dorea sp.]
MRDYQKEVVSYTRGRGRLTLVFQGYASCHNTEEILENAGYDPEADNENWTGSMFCSHEPDIMHHGRKCRSICTFLLSWREYLRKDKDAGKMHGDEADGNGRGVLRNGAAGGSPSKSGRSRDFGAEDRELEEIFMRTYGKIERKKPGNGPRTIIAQSQYKEEKPQEKVAEYLLVDGYNVIFAWDELKELAKVNMESARNKLMDILSNYQGFKKCTVILVFDAYKVDGDTLEIQKYHNIHVVYTKQAETADQYIEKVVHHIGRKRHVTVVTSDGVEQVVTRGQGSALISSREFYEEVEITRRQIQEEIKERTGGTKNYLFDHMDEAFVKEMEDVRLGKKDI